MSDLAMDLDTNDLLIENGDISIVDGSDAIAQDLQQTLQVWYGEWFLDTTVGIPFRQQVLIKNPNLDVIQAILLNAAANVPGVVQVNEIDFNYTNQNRTLDVTIVAQDSTGATLVSQPQITLPTNQTIQGTPYP